MNKAEYEEKIKDGEAYLKLKGEKLDGKLVYDEKEGWLDVFIMNDATPKLEKGKNWYVKHKTRDVRTIHKMVLCHLNRRDKLCEKVCIKWGNNAKPSPVS